MEPTRSCQSQRENITRPYISHQSIEGLSTGVTSLSMALAAHWLLGLLFTVLLPFLSVCLLRQKNNQKKIERKRSLLPPSPPKLPIIGNLHQLGKLSHISLLKLSETYGPVMLLQLGTVPTLVISSAAAAKQILKTHDLDFCTRPSSPGSRRLSYGYLDVTFIPYSDSWRNLRRLFVSEIHSPTRTQSLESARRAEVDLLIRELESLTTSSSVDLSEKISILVDGIVGTAAFGKRYGGMQFENRELSEVLEDAMDALSGASAEDFFPWVGWVLDLLTGHHGRIERSFQSLDGFFQMVIDEHLDPTRPKPEHEDMVDVLMELVSKDQNGGFTQEHVKAFLMNTFLGGTDSSAVTITWAMTELIKNSRAMNKLQTEIRNSNGKKPRLEQNDVAGLKYLKMVVKETLRLHPPAPLLIPREAIRHSKIAADDGDNNVYDVFPGTRILINAYAIGKDPKSWEDPLKFYPERFESVGVDYKGQHFELIPFGSGRRICPGLTMAITTVEYTLASLLYYFDWELPRGMEGEHVSTEEGGSLVVYKKTPLHLVPVKYTWQQQDRFESREEFPKKNC